MIADGIAKVEHLLRNHGLNGSPPSAGRHESAGSSQECTPGASIASELRGGIPEDEDDDCFSVFEGDSSLAAHTSFASQLLESVVERESLQKTHPDAARALMSLQQMASLRVTQSRPSPREPQFPYQKPLPRGGLKELPMPPMQLVVRLLRDAKGMPVPDSHPAKMRDQTDFASL